MLHVSPPAVTVEKKLIVGARWTEPMQHIRLDPLADLCDILTPDTATICFYTFTCRLHFRMDIIMQHIETGRVAHQKQHRQQLPAMLFSGHFTAAAVVAAAACHAIARRALAEVHPRARQQPPPAPPAPPGWPALQPVLLPSAQPALLCLHKVTCIVCAAYA